MLAPRDEPTAGELHGLLARQLRRLAIDPSRRRERRTTRRAARARQPHVRSSRSGSLPHRTVARRSRRRRWRSSTKSWRCRRRPRWPASATSSAACSTPRPTASSRSTPTGASRPSAAPPRRCSGGPRPQIDGRDVSELLERRARVGARASRCRPISTTTAGPRATARPSKAGGATDRSSPSRSR